MRFLLLSIGILLGLSTAPLACPDDEFEADVSMTPVFDPQGLVGFQHQWQVEAGHSIERIKAVDLDKNGKLSKKESDVLLATFRTQFEPVGFYLQVYAPSNKAIKSLPTQYDVQIVKGRIQYKFFIPYRMPADENDIHLVVGLYDPIGLNDLIWDTDAASQAPVVSGLDIESFADRVDNLKSFPPLVKSGEKKGLFLRFRKDLGGQIQKSSL